jgi:hypothetical protein
MAYLARRHHVNVPRRRQHSESKTQMNRFEREFLVKLVTFGIGILMFLCSRSAVALLPTPNWYSGIRDERRNLPKKLSQMQGLDFPRCSGWALPALFVAICINECDLSSVSVTTHDSMPPDAYFDRQWAMSILQHSLTDLELELGQQHSAKFQLLRPWLSGDSIEQSHADVAAKIGVSIEVVKTTIHRWRKRFREIVKSHIASTVSNVAEVDEELGYLIQALAANSRE